MLRSYFALYVGGAALRREVIRRKVESGQIDTSDDNNRLALGSVALQTLPIMTLIYWVSGIAAALIAARFAFNYFFPAHKPTKAEQDFDELSGGGV